MLVEKSLKEALEYYVKGKPVTALWMGEDGSMNTMPLSDILDKPENHFLVDVPAVENQEFKQAVNEMVGKSETVPLIEPEESRANPPADISTAKPKDYSERRNVLRANKKRKLVWDYYAKGTKTKDIVKLTELPESTVSNYITEYRKERGITREEKAKSEKLICDYSPAQRKNMPPRDKKAVVLGLVEQGGTIKAIAEMTGVPVGTVSYHATQYRKKKKKAESAKTTDGKSVNAENGKPVDNADRKYCETCVYRAANYDKHGCNYIDIEKHSRGCSVEACTKYIKGERRTRTQDDEEEQEWID